MICRLPGVSPGRLRKFFRISYVWRSIASAAEAAIGCRAATRSFSTLSETPQCAYYQSLNARRCRFLVSGAATPVGIKRKVAL